MFMHNDHQEFFCQNMETYRLNGNMAATDVGQRDINIYKGQKKIPVVRKLYRSGKRQNKGDQLANFKQGNGDYGGIAGWSDDGADITNELKLPANDFGLYDGRKCSGMG
jgi:hypothetical protein